MSLIEIREAYIENGNLESAMFDIVMFLENNRKKVWVMRDFLDCKKYTNVREPFIWKRGYILGISTELIRDTICYTLRVAKDNKEVREFIRRTSKGMNYIKINK